MCHAMEEAGDPLGHQSVRLSVFTPSQTRHPP